MDWVILAGTMGSEGKWTRGVPRALLPLPGTTLIDRLLDSYRQASDGTCTICANGHTKAIDARVSQAGGVGLRLGFFEDRLPRGTAGCLKACESRLTGETIFLIGAAVWIGDDPSELLKRHRDSNNALTVFCLPQDDTTATNRQSKMRPAGLYCCEPEVLKYVGTGGFQDLKEQLIPALKRAGLRVGALPLAQPALEISDWDSYTRLIDHVLSSAKLEEDGYSCVAPGIWVGRDVHLANTSRIVGPVLIGHGSRVEDDAVILGPTILGDGSFVGRGAILNRVVTGQGLQCGHGSLLVDHLEPGTKTNLTGPARMAGAGSLRTDAN